MTGENAIEELLHDTFQFIVSVYRYFKNSASFIAIVNKFWDDLRDIAFR